MTIPTEPIGSIPRPAALIEAVAKNGGDADDPALEPLFAEAIRDTIARFEATGSPVISDGEQRKYHNFFDYCVHGLPNMAPDGFKIPFAAGHTRRMPRLATAPFRYKEHADRYLEAALRLAKVPVKQAVISPSALSLLYPVDGIAGYSREEFIEDVLAEHVGEVRRCLAKGAHAVQIDFTEGRLAIKVDPTGNLLTSFIDLNNLALARFTSQERERIGVHTCPGGDLDSTHSADVDYAELLPSLLQLNLTNYYIALAGERDRRRVLGVIREHLRPGQRIFVGVIDPIDPRVETDEEVRDRVLEAAEYIPLAQLGTTDDCGFSPFSDDTSTRETRRSRRSAPGFVALRLPRPRSGEADAPGRRRPRASLGRAAERADDPASASARRAGAHQDQGGARRGEAHPRASQPDRRQAGVEARSAQRHRDGRRRRHPAERRAVRRVLPCDEQHRGRRLHAPRVVGRLPGGVRELRASAGRADPGGHARPCGRGTSVVRLADLCDDSRYEQAGSDESPGRSPVRSYLAVPVLARSGNVFGVLLLGHVKCGVFTERSERLVVGIAVQAAIAIDNARLYEDATRSADERARLLDAERAARLEIRAHQPGEGRVSRDSSHELRTPLNAVLGWSGVLLSRAQGDSEMKRGLETIARNARAQAQLIDDLLDMNRIVSGKIRLDVQPLELVTIIEAALDSVRPSAEAKSITVRRTIDPTAGLVFGDPNRLQQVVWNLLTNAVKFTPRAGRIRRHRPAGRLARRD